MTSSLASQLPPTAADEAALRPLPLHDALHEASKLAAPAADRRQPRNAGRASTEYAAPRPLHEQQMLGLGCWPGGRRGALKRGRWRSALRLCDGAARRGAVARLYNDPRAAGSPCCSQTPPLKTAAARFSDVIYSKSGPVRFYHF